MRTFAIAALRRLGIATRPFTMSAAVRQTRMQRWFPGTASPLVVSAPMAFVTSPKLASEVTRADGLGFIQGGRDFKPDSPTILALDEQLTHVKTLLRQAGKPIEPTLPIGVGFILYSDSASSHFGATAAPILARHRPAAIWFFAPHPDKPDTLRHVIESVLLLASPSPSAAESDWRPRIVVQVGTVAAAREAAEVGAHVIVAQGADAGGHQFAKAAGVVSLVPEVCDMLRSEFPEREIAVWGAGGIADGRGVAALLALGAEGAVMGTRYMVSPESDAQEYKRKALLAAEDGAANTVKSYIHDQVQGNWTWPLHYDARALVHPSYNDDVAGMDIKENEARYKAAKEKGDFSVMVTWSGSGVGLIRSAMPAAEVTKVVRDEAVAVIRGLKDMV
ncbi:FMN-dependent 2-nitropropane dioxygenase [Xylaria sp. CBS 124048]|nr:FMN-dependent 2-nitropropane dioxygenase [Xylaria sp. CBS 124048]